MSSDKKVLAAVFSEQDLLNKINDLKQQGYKENELHLFVQDPEQLDTVKNQTDIDIKQADSFKDKFKGFITGEGSVFGSVKALGLSDSETERYTEDVARGGILIYTDAGRPGIEEVIDESSFRDRSGNPVEPSTNEFVNSVDNSFDEQEDRFARGETFQQDPTLVKEEHHVSFSTQPKPEVEKARGSMTQAEKHSNSKDKYK